MEPTSHSLNEDTNTNEKTFSRGISLKACVAKAAGWTLEMANALPIQEASINKTLWLWVSWKLIDIEVTFHVTTGFGMTHMILKTITQIKTLKCGGFGLTHCKMMKKTPKFSLLNHTNTYMPWFPCWKSRATWHLDNPPYWDVRT